LTPGHDAEGLEIGGSCRILERQRKFRHTRKVVGSFGFDLDLSGHEVVDGTQVLVGTARRGSREVLRPTRLDVAGVE
jgi:hypothetical protein